MEKFYDHVISHHKLTLSRNFLPPGLCLDESENLRVVFYADSDAINRFENFRHLEVLFPSTISELILTIILYRQSPSG